MEGPQDHKGLKGWCTVGE